ncbi:MAG: hypothetical protein WC308_00205 [archaeon]|jgi:DNA primase large subunit
MDDISFSQEFPFTEKARNVLKKSGVSLDSAPKQAFEIARELVLFSAAGKQKMFELSNPSEEDLMNELMAFPIAKMLVSVMKHPRIIEKFSMMIEKKTFSYLTTAKKQKELSVDLALELGINFSLLEGEFFVQLPLTEFLQINFNDEELKLVNLAVSGGNIFLATNDFARFLSEVAYKKVFDSLPISADDIPGEFKQFARAIENQIGSIERKDFDLKVSGKANPNFFPPCMKALYVDLLAGKRLSYTARITIASFLYQVGFSQEELLVLFSKSPDYKPHIARYHIARIFDKKLSAPGCKKIKEYGLKIKECEQECNYKHPLRYYLSKVRQSKKQIVSEKPEREKASIGGSGAE